MIEREVKVVHRLGLHARPAIRFVQKAGQFGCDITVIKGEKQANAKSISNIMNLKVRQNDLIRIRAEGKGDVEALAVLIDLLMSVKHLSEDSEQSEM